MNIKCAIIEDEPLAVEVISDFIRQVPFLELAAVCNDAFSAMEVLQHQQIDLIFLDIHLPKLKGLDFLAMLKKPPLVVITTAYHEFALKSYEYNVIDYLLKPVPFERFMAAISKVVDRMHPQKKIEIPIVANDEACLFFMVNKKKARISLNSILYIESQREYLKVVTNAKTILTRYLIAAVEKELPPESFIRVHRSFIVARNKIDLIDANSIEIGKNEIPIGRSYKKQVLQTLGFKETE